MRPLLVAAAALALTLGGLAAGGPASAAPAAPASAGPRCGTGASSGNVNTCITANGSGLHVNYIDVTAEVLNSGRNIQVCIRGPQVSHGCAPGLHSYEYVAPGYYIPYEWAPNAIEAAGDYCANTYRLNNDGSNTQIGHECINVHA
jgi:hypothetical protein